MCDDLKRLSTTELAEEREFRARIRAMMPFDWVTVSGENALDEWFRLKWAGDGYPIVVGDDNSLKFLAEGYAGRDDCDPQHVVATATASAATASAIAGSAIAASVADLLEDDDFPSDGEWPDQVGPQAELTVVPVQAGRLVREPTARDVLAHKPFDRVHILLVPAKASWEVPAYLRWGTWNDCPMPVEHVAALWQWYERYGVELVGLDSDTMNLLAQRSPATREEALELARAQYCYCPDIVDQGVGTISALAAGLMASKWWLFWWD